MAHLLHWGNKKDFPEATTNLTTSMLRSFERQALKLLVGQVLSPAAIDRVIREATDVSPIIEGSVYTVEVFHAELPPDHDYFELPIVTGHYQDVEVRFTAELNDRTLRLFCTAITENARLSHEFREGDVKVVLQEGHTNGSVDGA